MRRGPKVRQRVGLGQLGLTAEQSRQGQQAQKAGQVVLEEVAPPLARSRVA